MNKTFSSMNLNACLQEALASVNFTTPTDIQEKVIPFLLQTPHAHIHGQAQTGTGKTLAFGLPILERIDKNSKYPQALIVAPTRELALQTHDSLLPFAKACNVRITTIYGGVSIEEQIRTLSRGVQIVIGTPGRINDHIKRRTFDTSKIKTLVLDEADIMLDMGFREEIDIILDRTPESKEIWLFSATVKSGIQDLLSTHMPDAHTFRVSKQNIGTTSIKQFYSIAPSRERTNVITRFIEANPDFYGFIFCQTKILTSEVAEQLSLRGFHVGALHGDLSQSQRTYVIKSFRQRTISILVATDVAARGIDIADLTHVINYSLPEDLESYIHRIGRTGRAGKEGISISFIGKSEVRSIKMLEKKFSVTINPINPPTLADISAKRLEVLATHWGTLTDIPLTHTHTHNQRIEHDIKDKILALTTSYDEESLKLLLVNYVFETHFKDLLSQKETAPQQPSFENQPRGESDVHEIALSVGSDDDITEAMVLDAIIEHAKLAPEDIRKIRVIKRKTFINVPSAASASVIDALHAIKIEGRRLDPKRTYDEENREQRSGSRYGDDRGGSRSSGRGGYGRSDDRGGESRSEGSRGGYGVMQFLDKLNPQGLLNNPKWLIGIVLHERSARFVYFAPVCN